jgi:hypothetical protein
LVADAWNTLPSEYILSDTSTQFILSRSLLSKYGRLRRLQRSKPRSFFRRCSLESSRFFGVFLNFNIALTIGGRVRTRIASPDQPRRDDEAAAQTEAEAMAFVVCHAIDANLQLARLLGRQERNHQKEGTPAMEAGARPRSPQMIEKIGGRGGTRTRGPLLAKQTG